MVRLHASVLAGSRFRSSWHHIESVLSVMWPSSRVKAEQAYFKSVLEKLTVPREMLACEARCSRLEATEWNEHSALVRKCCNLLERDGLRLVRYDGAIAQWLERYAKAMKLDELEMRRLELASASIEKSVKAIDQWYAVERLCCMCEESCRFVEGNVWSAGDEEAMADMILGLPSAESGERQYRSPQSALDFLAESARACAAACRRDLVVLDADPEIEWAAQRRDAREAADVADTAEVALVDVSEDPVQADVQIAQLRLRQATQRHRRALVALAETKRLRKAWAAAASDVAHLRHRIETTAHLLDTVPTICRDLCTSVAAAIDARVDFILGTVRSDIASARKRAAAGAKMEAQKYFESTHAIEAALEAEVADIQTLLVAATEQRRRAARPGTASLDRLAAIRAVLDAKRTQLRQHRDSRSTFALALNGQMPWLPGRRIMSTQEQ